MRAKPETGVIWVDAHADLNVPEVSESGNMHGMPIGLMMKELMPDRSVIPGLEWLEEESEDGTGPPSLPPNQLVYVGLRDIDQAERHFIKQLGIKQVRWACIHQGAKHLLPPAGRIGFPTV